jgi:molybdate transport system substrate-binding protein
MITTTRRTILALAIATVGIFSPALQSSAIAADTLTVFAAASLKNGLDAVDAAFAAKTGKSVSVSYAASSALAKQIESGAPADVFLSADLAWMDYLAEKSLIKADTRSNLLGNSLVLVGSSANAKTVEITKDLDLSGLLSGGKLAMGAVDSVPAGKYGKAALEKLGLWDAVSASVAGTENVRAALLLVSRGEAPYGIVYKTDAAADPGVTIAGTFPEDSHPPIIYPVAQTSASQNSDVAAYLDFLKSEEASKLFAAQGFNILK